MELQTYGSSDSWKYRQMEVQTDRSTDRWKYRQMEVQQMVGQIGGGAQLQLIEITKIQVKGQARSSEE